MPAALPLEGAQLRSDPLGRDMSVLSELIDAITHPYEEVAVACRLLEAFDGAAGWNSHIHESGNRAGCSREEKDLSRKGNFSFTAAVGDGLARTELRGKSPQASRGMCGLAVLQQAGADRKQTLRLTSKLLRRTREGHGMLLKKKPPAPSVRRGTGAMRRVGRR